MKVISSGNSYEVFDDTLKTYEKFPTQSYVLLPTMKDRFIKDNYAGQIGKGTLFGLNRLSENLHNFYDKYGSDGYILKCDITKFFYRIVVASFVPREPSTKSFCISTTIKSFFISILLIMYCILYL